MLIRKNIFVKMNVLLLLFLLPILLLYSYSNVTNVNVVKNTIQSANTNQLAFFLNQMEEKVNQIAMYSLMMSRDPNVSLLPDIKYLDSFQQRQLKLLIDQTLKLQSLSTSWQNQLNIYNLASDEIFGTTFFSLFNPVEVQKMPADQWNFIPDKKNSQGHSTFIRYHVEKDSESNGSSPSGLLIYTSFPSANVVRMLSEFKQENNSDPFFYHADYENINNDSANKMLIGELIKQFKKEKLTGSGNKNFTIEGKSYSINYVESLLPGWFLVDYLPLDKVLSPITTSRNLFYLSLAVLLLLSVFASFLLYRNVQLPISTLIRNVQRFAKGDFGTRITRKSNTEFDFLFEKFNIMAEEIQGLIEKVLIEQIQTKDATLKQLQSQINPHFFYNCLFFINNMVRLEDDEAITAMTMNLAEYFRYTTRTDKISATLSEEIQLVRNYLEIQSLRMDYLQYEIAIPDKMAELELPRLIVQPLVENAIVHGIEKKEGEGYVKIMGEQTAEFNLLIVEDNGDSVTDTQIQEFTLLMAQQPQEMNRGFALWNIQQRLALHFDKRAELILERSELGGIRALIQWPRNR